MGGCLLKLIGDGSFSPPITSLKLKQQVLLSACAASSATGLLERAAYLSGQFTANERLSGSSNGVLCADKFTFSVPEHSAVQAPGW